jgi:hypothetical protein
MEQLHTPKVCNLCGAEEPQPWWQQPMNETIRAYAQSYTSPVKTFNTSLLAELEAWGLSEGLE